jgi:hypothetical protein
MARQHAYATVNKLSGIADSAITLSTGSTTNRGRLVDARQDKQWDSGTIAAGVVVNLDFDAGSAIAATGVAVLNHNCTDADPTFVRLRGADDSAFSVNLVSGNNQNLREGNGAAFINSTGATVSKRYWRVVLDLPASQTQLKVGEVYLFAHTALARFEVYGRGAGQRFSTTGGESDVGRLFGHYLSGPHAVKRLVWEDLSTAQLDEVQTMLAAAKGNARDILWLQSVDYTSAATIEASQECYLGRFQEKELVPNETDFDLWNNISLTFREQSRGVGV